MWLEATQTINRKTVETIMNASVAHFSVHVERIDGFEFKVRFDKEQFADLHMDEPPPLGRDTAPNATRVLAAAIGNCLAASLVFCLQRAKIAVRNVTADVDVEIVRNESRRLRVGSVDVTLRPEMTNSGDALDPCLDTFEDFCVVTQSVRQGIDVRVRVEPMQSAQS